MDALRLETMSINPKSHDVRGREKAQKAADQFEAVFVKTFVSSMRQTATVGDEQGGMFGQGPGAGTYASWFDDNVSTELARTGGIGIAKALLSEMERDGSVVKDQKAYQEQRGPQVLRLQRIANGSDLTATMAKDTGGLNELL